MRRSPPKRESPCKISSKSVQHFRRRCVQNRQTNRKHLPLPSGDNDCVDNDDFPLLRLFVVVPFTLKGHLSKSAKLLFTLNVTRPDHTLLLFDSKGLSRLSHQAGGISVVSGGGHVRREYLNLSAILMYIVSMISNDPPSITFLIISTQMTYSYMSLNSEDFNDCSHGSLCR